MFYSGEILVVMQTPQFGAYQSSREVGEIIHAAPCVYGSSYREVLSAVVD